MRLPTISLKPIAFLAALFCLAAAPAFAAGTGYGSNAWSLTNITLRDGPGNAYAVTGGITGQTRIIVDRCHYRWCDVSDGHAKGWVSIDDITFGVEPRGPLSGPRLNYASGGPGQVCFFSGTNYTGTKTCATSGTVVRDLKLFGIDNTFASVTVEGYVNAMVCRDFDFTDDCQRIVKDQPTMRKFLNRSISSFRVY